jgi:hypothetical protein
MNQSNFASLVFETDSLETVIHNHNLYSTIHTLLAILKQGPYEYLEMELGQAAKVKYKNS